MSATVTPPSAAPPTTSMRIVICIVAAPSAYFSRGRMSPRIALRAASNGGCTVVTAYSRTIRTASGVPGTSMAMTKAALMRSHATMTRRRGNLSARPERKSAPNI
jgi:hypothetical protein